MVSEQLTPCCYEMKDSSLHLQSATGTNYPVFPGIFSLVSPHAFICLAHPLVW
jgi:hypothetical protein